MVGDAHPTAISCCTSKLPVDVYPSSCGTGILPVRVMQIKCMVGHTGEAER